MDGFPVHAIPHREAREFKSNNTLYDVQSALLVSLFSLNYNTKHAYEIYAKKYFYWRIMAFSMCKHFFLKKKKRKEKRPKEFRLLIWSTTQTVRVDIMLKYMYLKETAITKTTSLSTPWMSSAYKTSILVYLLTNEEGSILGNTNIKKQANVIQNSCG